MSRSSQRSTIKDMTNGSPAKLILGFAVPMLMGLLFQQFYSMVDTIIVGKFLGVDALASVGSTSAINFMINGFVIGVCTGFSIPVAQRFGAQDYKDMRRFVANAGWIASCFAVVMTVIVCLLTRQILVWMQTPDNIIDGAYSYIFFVFAGIPATYLYNTLAGIIRALGDEWPVYREQLESGGYADQFFAANYLAGDDPVFVSFLANVPDSVKTKLAECEWSAE